MGLMNVLDPFHIDRDLFNAGRGDFSGFKRMGALADPGGKLSDLYHTVSGTPTGAQKRVQINAIEGEIRAYKAQTDMAEKELNMKRDQLTAEKRRVNEKQIRALRRNSRSGGFMNSNDDTLNNKLGV